VVLDASAVLALLYQEPGGQAVAAHLPGALISAVNLSEVAAKLADDSIPPGDIAVTLGGLGLDVQPFDAAMAVAAGLLRPATRHLGLSLGDRACLALAQSVQGVALTTDRAWSRFAGVELIR
jgi:PIN domain nuclease of toxin-antitoxin system